MTLHQLKVFVTVAKLNSVAQAAKALHISQPSVSGVIQDLQEELEIKLFERLGNKRKLTEAGYRLSERAQHSLGIIEGIKEELDELKGLKKGKLSVGSAGIATPLILQAVHKFRDRFPGIEVGLAIQKTVTLYQKLLDGQLDVAVLGRPSPSPLIRAEPYREEEMVFIAAPNHPLTKKRSVPLTVLAAHLIASKGPMRQVIERTFAKAGLSFLPLVEIDLQMGTREAVKSAVASGIGISYVSKCHVTADLKAGRLKTIRVPELRLKRTMYIAAHKNASCLVRAFTEFLKNSRSASPVLPLTQKAASEKTAG